MVVWVFENIWEVIFDVMKVCEIYVISGMCIVLCFFVSWDYFNEILGFINFVECVYVVGVLMGVVFLV